jgi:hypothetical protein
MFAVSALWRFAGRKSSSEGALEGIIEEVDHGEED